MCCPCYGNCECVDVPVWFDGLGEYILYWCDCEWDWDCVMRAVTVPVTPGMNVSVIMSVSVHVFMSVNVIMSVSVSVMCRR